MNRHGLVAGATGTGKTKTLQVIAGQLSDAGVPVFVADLKGDLSRLAQPIEADDPRVLQRAASLAWAVEPTGHPVELLSLSGANGAPVRATVESLRPVLLAKMLDLNETQTAVLSLVVRREEAQRRSEVGQVEQRLRREGGGGVISLLELAEVMDRPRLFSTFMLWLLARMYALLPEIGDPTSRSWPSSSTRRTCCSTMRPTRCSNRSS